MNRTLLFAVSLLVIGSVNGQTQLGQTLTGAGAGQRFGAQVAISDDGTRIAIVNAANGSQGSMNASVQVYDRSGSTWTQTGNSTFAVSGQTTANLHPTIDLSGDGKTLAIGNPTFSSGGASNVGQVELFEDASNNGTWIKKGSTLVGPSPEGAFGRQVQVIEQGSQFSTGVFTGDVDAERGVYAYIFENADWAPRGTQPVLQAFRETEVHAIASGSSGGRLAVTYSQNNAGQSFQVHQYLIPTSSWLVQVQKQSPVADVGYGESIALANLGFTAAVGAPREGTGVVRVYNGDGNLTGNEISVSQTANLGQHVALSENAGRLVVGAPGNATTMGKVIVFDFIGGTWTPVFTFDGQELNDQTGLAFDLSSNGNFLVISRPNLDATGAADQGQVLVYDLSGNSNVRTANEANLTLSPNPTRDLLRINGLDQDGALATIYDAAGRVVLTEKLSGFETNVAELSSGTYFLVLELKDGPVRLSFVKE